MTKPLTDRDYLIEAEEALAFSGCDFWACKGPTLFPIPMVTCYRCRTLARLRRRLGLPIRGADGWDIGQAGASERARQADLRRAVHA